MLLLARLPAGRPASPSVAPVQVAAREVSRRRLPGCSCAHDAHPQHQALPAWSCPQEAHLLQHVRMGHLFQVQAVLLARPTSATQTAGLLLMMDVLHAPTRRACRKQPEGNAVSERHGSFVQVTQWPRALQPLQSHQHHFAAHQTGSSPPSRQHAPAEPLCCSGPTASVGPVSSLIAPPARTKPRSSLRGTACQQASYRENGPSAGRRGALTC